MPRFDFKLEPVLRHRRRAEGEQRQKLAALLRRRQDMHDQLRRMQTDLSTDRQRMADRLVGHVDVDRIRMHGAHHAQVARRAQGIMQQLAGVEEQIEQVRRDLLEATRHRRAIEQLRERQRQQWLKRLRRREAAAVDELATQRYGYANGHRHGDGEDLR